MIHWKLPPSLRRRARYLMLAAAVMIGLGVSAYEKFRQDDTYAIWSASRIGLSTLLNPAREHTRNVVERMGNMGNFLDAERENRRLQRELTRLKLQHQLTIEELGRLQRLTGLGRWSGPPEVTFVPADVIAMVVQAETVNFVINRGANHGVRPLDPVVALGGLVGVVRLVEKDSAQVQAITDLDHRVGAVATLGRIRGVVSGGGRSKPLQFVPENEMQPIQIGAEVITSGFRNSIYPKGIVIGQIVDKAANDYGVPYGVVKQAVDLDQIEEVLLVMPKNRDGDNPTSRTLGQFEIDMPELNAGSGGELSTSSTDGSTTASKGGSQ